MTRLRSAKSDPTELTFSSPPQIPRVMDVLPNEFGPEANELLEIVRENASLIDRLSKINARPSEMLAKQQNLSYTQKMSVAHASINRRKELDKIERENLRLFKRLQSVKPCKEIRRDVLQRFHEQNQKYLENCSTFKSQK